MLVEVFRRGISNYLNFSGRTSRKEYWLFFLDFLIVIFSLGILTAIGFAIHLGVIFIILDVVAYFGMIIPSISITVRRIHDGGRSGLFYLVGLIPIIGGVWVFILTILPSTPGANQYGELPSSL